MDDSRKQDLEELMYLYKYAPQWRRREIEKIIEKIYRETPEVRSTREDLIKAIRAGDRHTVRKIQERLRVLEKYMTGGRETIKYG